VDAEPQSFAQAVVHRRPQPPAGCLEPRGRTC
jgi:hypothetical protein